MRIAVIGAGAIGAFVGASFARAGADVTLVARGEHMRAMRASGVRVRGERGDFTAHPGVTDDLRTVGSVDVAILSLKAHQIGGVLADLPAIFDGDTCVIAMQNGLPWWYFEGAHGPLAGQRVECVDPGGRIAATIAPERRIGCVVYAAAEVVAPGVVEQSGVARFVLGAPTAAVADRIPAIANAFVAAGFEAPYDLDIRVEMWRKLLGNMSFNPVSVLTHATLSDLATDPLAAPVLRDMMVECLAICSRLGIALDETVDRRIERARQVGAHKTSMLQDLEAGRPLEIEAMLGALVEVAERLEIPVPASRYVYGLVKLRERAT